MHFDCKLRLSYSFDPITGFKTELPPKTLKPKVPDQPPFAVSFFRCLGTLLFSVPYYETHSYYMPDMKLIPELSPNRHSSHVGL